VAHVSFRGGATERTEHALSIWRIVDSAPVRIAAADWQDVSEPPRLLDHEPSGTQVCFGDHGLEITVPSGSARQLYYRIGPDWVALSDDQRLLVDQECQLDEFGLLSAMSLRALLIAQTPWSGIQRLAPGVTWRFGRTLERTALEAGSVPDHPQAEPSDGSTLVRRVDEELTEGLRTTVPEGRVALMFSGGVDSGLLAALLARRRDLDTVLWHSSRGEGDPESELAVAMAAHLRLPMRVFRYQAERAVGNLDGIFESQTITADFSILPTWQLIADATEGGNHDTRVMEGTGADALFSDDRRSRQWAAVYAVPSIIRRTFASAVAALGGWRLYDRRENPIRALLRSAVLPERIVTLVAHPMAGIGYEFSPSDGARLDHAHAEWMESIARARPGSVIRPYRQAAAVASKGMLKHYTLTDSTTGRPPISPFIADSFLSFVSREVSQWPERDRGDKAVLKRLLASFVPREMVYRDKHGFSVDPISLFAQPRLLDAANAALTGDGPLRPRLRRAVGESLVNTIRRQRRLPWYVYEYVWLVTMTHHWIQRVCAAAPRRLVEGSRS
jgi:asparagine synthase (glutamine-hydrolysing)